MNSYIIDPWKIVEDGFNPENNRISESIFSLGNGSMGQRGNFEEFYSGDSLQGSYIGGVYYPDKTKVGWWKNGYPEYFAKVLNSVNWIGLNIDIEGEPLDLHHWKVESFKRVLDMKKGLLSRDFIARSPMGNRVKVNVKRFISMKRKDLGVISYSITPVDRSLNLSISSFLDGNISNEDSNYNEKFWEIEEYNTNNDILSILSKTKKTGFKLLSLAKNCFNMEFDSRDEVLNDGYVANRYNFNLSEEKTLNLIKYTVLNSTFSCKEEELHSKSNTTLTEALNLGWDNLLKEHIESWERIWSVSDIIIEGMMFGC